MQKLALFFGAFYLSTIFLYSLSGCSDWRLRGNGANHLTMSTIYLDLDNSGHSSREELSVYREIHSILTRQQMLAPRKQAEIQLVVGKQNFNRRTVSINNRSRAAEFQLVSTTPYTILGQEGSILYKSIASLTRSYRFNEQDIVGSSKEEELLKKEMTRDTAYQILRHVNSYLESRS